MKPFPRNAPTLQEAKDDFDKLLDLNATALMKEGNWYTRYEYESELKPIYIDTNNTGNVSSNHFHFDARMACDSLNSPSAIRNWYNPKLFETTMKCKIVDDDFSKLSLRKYIPSQFRPSAAKCLIDFFKAKDVYDPCAGWGDRLSGFLASSAESYIGTDTNQHLFLPYYRQIQELNVNDKQVDMFLERAEAFEHQTEYDFVMTSPPYYKVEKYDGLWSSHNKYKKFDAWLEKFLFEMLKNSLTNLKKGGTMCINISDVYADHRVNQICDPMVEYMTKDLGATFKGAIGYRMRKRVNSKSAGDGVFAEPIWIFTK